MKNETQHIVRRSLIVYLLFLVFAAFIVAKLIHIQYIEGNKYRSLAQKYTIREVRIPANRGNIYAADKSVLATSVPNYDIYFDPTVPKESVFKAQVNQLAASLSRFLGVQKSDLKRKFVLARKNNKQYVPIVKKLNYSDYTKIKNFPIFKLGMNKGGFIAEQHTIRAYPLGGIMRRTLGFDRGDGNRVGIEGSFSKYLTGKDGMQKKQKISYGIWKPLSDINDVEPQNGYDILTTINIDFQDIAHNSLKKQLQEFEANHGSVVVMEVKTGAIKALVNLGKNKLGDYEELRNYAVYEIHEPGSTFKLFSVMALLEDKVADTSSVVDTEKGVYEVYDAKIRDSHKGGLGKISLKKVFEKSSNVGVVKMVYENYKEHPQKFVNRLYNFGVHEKIGIEIRGEGTPIIPNPKDKNWSGLSLPWMSYGYGVELTALQTLTYYNAIANNGKMMKPYIVDEVKSFSKTIKKYKPKALNSSLCSKETVHKMKDLLRGVVQEGTATNINDPYLKLAGKTGTCQTEYWKQKGQYIASFVGYFPADNPKYSIIVEVHKPNPEKGYYGADVAAPVFREIASYIYGKLPEEQSIVLEDEYKSDRADKILEKYKTIMPDLRGLSSKEAVYVLENMGLIVRLSGSGTVRYQSVPRGEKIKKNQLIELKLS